MDNGYKVKPKGRISADLLAIYQAKVLKKRAPRDSNRSSGTGDSVVRLRDGDSEPDLGSASKPKRLKRSSCGFCTVNAAHQHKNCPGTINQGKMGIWTCLCYEKEHTLYVLHM